MRERKNEIQGSPLSVRSAESAKTPFDSPDWIFEIKLDGYRAITVFDAAGKPHLWSRNGLALEAKFPAVATAVSKLKLRSTILDGEIVAVDKNGIPRFQLLQRFQKQPTAPTLSYVFDVLWYNGDDLTGNPMRPKEAGSIWVLSCSVLTPMANSATTATLN
ncbi:MAG: hypothetical protein WAK31_07090 [Chthoniobacterales bacterium]